MEVLVDLGDIRNALIRWLAAHDAATYKGSDALGIAVELGQLGNVVQHGRATFGHRAADVGSGGPGVTKPARVRRKEDSCNTTPTHAARHIAFRTGQDPNAIQRDINTIDQLPRMLAVAQALASREISMTQAGVIAPAALAQPQLADKLVDRAKRTDLPTLAEEAKRIKNNATSWSSRESRAKQACKQRSVRSFRDHYNDEQFKLLLQGPIMDFAPLSAKLESETQRRFDEAKQSGTPLSYDNCRYDALVEFLMDSGEEDGTFSRQPMRGAKSQVVINVDLQALARGWTEGAEVCSVPGVGDVAVSAAWSVLETSIVRILVTDGDAVVTTLTTDGRKLTAETYAIAVARDQECSNPRCHNTKNLQLDHRRPSAEGGPGTLNNLAMLCDECHYLKTHHGWCLVGPRGDWEWIKRRESGDGGSGYPLDFNEDPADYFALRTSA